MTPSLPLTATAPCNRLLAEICAGLAQPQKRLPTRLLYDRRGSRLFDLICATPEYYVTRTELAIMRDHAADMSAFLGPRCLLIEPGAGSGAKTQILLAALRKPAGYVPVDVAADHLRECAQRVQAAHPGLPVRPVCADFTQPLAAPPGVASARTAIYFPGSTIGNFEPAAAVRLLAAFRRLAGANGALLIGVDTRKAPALLERAYDDAAGWTARFNLNLLLRLNREFGGSFDLDYFRHHAFFNAVHGRVEMHLRSLRAQTVRVGGRLWALRAGETFHTENSYKYSPTAFAALAAQAGWAPRRFWSDARGWFSVQGYAAG